MKLGILSDLHIEFDKIGQWDFNPEPDVFYLCAGDINSNHYERQAFVSKHHDHIFYVNGNHDYYGREFPGKHQTKEIIKDGLKIVGATLWTDLSNPKDWYNYVTGLVDSRYINDLSYESYNERFSEHLDFIACSGADIVVTHHCPTKRAIAPQFQNPESQKYNPAFASDLEQTIRNFAKPPKLWVYGHTHWKHSYMIDQTLFVCHPRGYPGENPGPYEPLILDLET